MVTRSLRVALAACTLLFATVIAGDAGAGTISSLRVKLSPLAAPRGTLPDTVRTHLESVLGTSFDVAKVTRTGALDLAFSPALDARDAASAVAALRNDRMVLWAEMPSRLPSTTPALRPKSATPETSRKFMVRLKDDQADIAPLLADLSLRIGVPIAVDRQIGPVWVLTVLQSRSVDTLDALAEVIQQHPQVEYADAVHRLTIKRVPNDPLYPAQWNLTDALAGIDLPAAWDLETGSPNIIVGVVDTGIRSHPDNIGRILPGYDFISDKDSARDGDGRDPDATDEGDWTEDGECFGAPAEASSWHGTFVAGLIAANANNGIGIAGVDWNAKVVPARALGRCGGLLDDVYAAVRWVAGLPVDNVPPNSYPAKVINMSLGGEHGCFHAIQDAIDDVLAQGTVVVVAAGNENADATGFTPAGCSGVITVGAVTRAGDRTVYSNLGPRVDISAPGGNTPSQNLVVSLSNDGITHAGSPSYAWEQGTSFSAPLVTGTVSLMLARNALLTPGRVLSILQATSRDYPGGAVCQSLDSCGSGLLDAGLALASTPPGLSTAPPGAVTVVEYYRADRDHYFLTADPNEIAYVDGALGGVFQRTGFYFYAYPSPVAAPLPVRPVCRFYAAGLIDSHYYSASADECAYVAANYAGVWKLETSNAFYVPVPDANGTCPDNTLPVYRFFDNRVDANHRYTTDLTVRRAMLNRQWVSEGQGALGVAFCSPI